MAVPAAKFAYKLPLAKSKRNTDTDTATDTVATVAKKAARNHQTAHETCQGKQKKEEINGESTTERNKTISVENISMIARHKCKCKSDSKRQRPF